MVADLNERITACAAAWSLTQLQQLTKSVHACVLTAYSANYQKLVVLKLINGYQAFECEKDALTVYNGNGAVPLIAFNPDAHALLLEQLVPGASLAVFFPRGDEQAVMHTVEIMHKLHAASLPARHTFPSVSDLLSLLNINLSPAISQAHLERACAIAHELLASASDAVLCHGDLHHGNILSSGTDWRAIDPKGVVGEPLYDVGAFIRNPWPDLLKERHAREIIKRRIELFAQLLSADRERIKAWSYVQAVLAACWCVEDHSDPAPFLHIAAWIQSL